MGKAKQFLGSTKKASKQKDTSVVQPIESRDMAIIDGLSRLQQLQMTSLPVG